MCEIKFRARISPKTIIAFTLDDLVNPNPLFSIRELVIPWLRAGNKPAVLCQTCAGTGWIEQK